MILPRLRITRQYNDVQDTFFGYNNNLKTRESEWADMNNVSPRSFPMFAPRTPRSTVKTLTSANGLIARDAIVYVDGATIYVNDLAVTGLVLSTEPKTLVSMGAYIIIMPDKKYVNTADFSDYGSIESSMSYTGDITIVPARVDGSYFFVSVIGVDPPVAPANNDYWIDTSMEQHTLKQYSAMSDTWTVVPSTYVKIEIPGIGAYFSDNDGVNIAGIEFSGTDPDLVKQIPLLNGSKIIYAKGDDYIIVAGLLSAVQTLTGITVTVKRVMPSMDYLTESENRLWGCKYGVVDGKTVNEIYACALGDFKNWSKYMGISTDSYAANVGSDGEFTGAITHLGYPLFFKENFMHKIYGNFPSNYRIETIACRGVQKGSHKSLALVNELLFYKGRTEVLVYDGSLPIGVSSALGGVQYSDAVGGAFKDRYYISMNDGFEYTMFFYDTQKRLWFKEDNTQVKEFAQLDDDLYYITGNKLMAEFGTVGTKEGAVSFYATTGIIGYTSKDRKYVNRINIRAKMASASSMVVFFRYDSTGEWVKAGEMSGDGVTKTVMMPIKPKRCDHFEIKLSGSGDVQIFSIAKILEIGGDGA